MSRTPSFTDELDLTPGEPVTRPARSSAPDLAPWIARLRDVDLQTRQSGRTNIAIPFNLPADRTVQTEKGTKVVSAAKTAKLRFQQAATELGIGVSIVIEPVNEKVSRILVSTMERRKHEKNGSTQVTASDSAAKTVVPSGLPKPPDLMEDLIQSLKPKRSK